MAGSAAIQTVDYEVLAPLLVLALGALVVLVLDLFGHRRPQVVGWVALAVVVAAGACLALSAGGQTLCSTSGQCAYAVGQVASAFQLVVLVSSGVVVLLSVTTVGELRLPAGEYYFLLLASVSGAVAVAGTQDLVSLLVVLEVASLPTFALVALRHDDPRAAEGALKIFLYSVVSVAVAVYGLALVYGSTGSVRFDDVRAALADPSSHTPVAAVGIVLVLVVFLFKVAAVPVHTWAPDTYQSAPVPVAAYLSVVSKVAGFAGLSLVLLAFAPWQAVWSWPLAAASAATMVVANVAALRQTRAVRLLAWSSIAQAGYVLVPFAALVATGQPRIAPLTAVVAYLAVYAAMNLGAFAVVCAVARESPDPRLADFDGLFRRQPWAAVGLAFFLAALAGLPPGLSGLFVKVGVLAVPLGTGAWVLALLMAAATIVGLAYYLAFAARLFRHGTADRGGPLSVSRPVAAAVAATFGLTVLLSVAPALAFGLVSS